MADSIKSLQDKGFGSHGGQQYKVNHDIVPLKKRVLVSDMHFGETKTAGGLIIPDDDGTASGVHPRWAKVYAVGKEQDDVQVGQWVMVAHGRWSRAFKVAKEGVELPDYVIEAIEEVLAEDEDFVIESEDLDASAASKALTHDCAKHVVHKEHGEGQCVPGMHTLEENEDGTGFVTHYDVMFGDTIVEDVPVEELEIVSEMHHGHPKKKDKK